MLVAVLRNFTSELSVKCWDHFSSQAALCVQLHTQVHPPKVGTKRKHLPASHSQNSCPTHMVPLGQAVKPNSLQFVVRATLACDYNTPSSLPPWLFILNRMEPYA